MSENNQNPNSQSQDQSVEQQKEAVKKEAKGLFKTFRGFLGGLLDFRHDTDRESTIELIKADIPFRGATAWILICSIFIACIGLNANSIPVVIGAMLISPLMGPILGMGMAIAVNDIDTLRKSIANFVVMVCLSVFTAWLFFYLFPLKVESSELLARTKPDIRDVLIAFFGGLALIIARTKKGTIASVIFGVAIATALMPPLCTVGFGLAIKNWKYAYMAMYLFTINTIFIGLATFIVLKLLGFPMIRYANSAKRKLIARLASFTALLVMIPAVYTFWITYNLSKEKGDFEAFINQEIKANPSLLLRDGVPDYDNKTIAVYLDGEISQSTIDDLQSEILKYENIKDFTLSIRGNKARGLEQVSKAYDRSIVELTRLEKENAELLGRIEELETQLTDTGNSLKIATAGNPRLKSFESIAKDAKINFSDLSELGYGEVLLSDFKKMDTVKVIFPIWKRRLSSIKHNERNDQLKELIKKQLNIKDLVVKE